MWVSSLRVAADGAFSLAEQAVALLTSAKQIVGDKAYRSQGNAKWCEANDLDLITRAKSNEDRASAKWTESVREIAKLENEQPEAFKRLYGQRSVIEAIPSSTKRQQRFCRLRKRVADPTVTVSAATDPSESALTSRPLEELLEIVRKAEEAVGAAPCNEILAIHLIGNLRKIVTLEALHDQRVRFVPGFVFEPIPTVWLDDLDDGGTSAASEAEGA